jgi:hypothetical protein
MRLCLALFALGSVAAFAASTNVAKPTFTKDVAPIIFKRCVECHRAGEVAPMAFTNYKEVRPWAKAIKERVASRAMPVWLADPHYGNFRNDRRLAQAEIDTIVNWVDTGALEGKEKDMPSLPKFDTGWTLGKPDQVFDIGTDYAVPAEGTIAYKYFTVPTNFTEDKWVSLAEIRPGSRSAVHHIIVTVIDPGKSTPRSGEGDALLAGYAPGEQPLKLEPGTAKLIKAGSSLRFQLHYTPNSTAYRDRSYIGLTYAKEPVKYQAMTGNALQFNFKIPAGDPNYEVKSTWTAKKDVQLVGLMPHMHVRGKDFKYTVTYPDGRQEVILDVPKYDFNWQLSYEFAKYLTLPVGTRIDCVAHFDNSVNNRYNPDPTKDVKWGDQTWEEMMIGWFTYVVPAPESGPAAAKGVE